jgi:hypothetical protein
MGWILVLMVSSLIFVYRRDAEAAEKIGPGIEFKVQDEKISTPRLLCALCVTAVDSEYGKQVPLVIFVYRRDAEAKETGLES